MFRDRDISLGRCNGNGFAGFRHTEVFGNIDGDYQLGSTQFHLNIFHSNHPPYCLLSLPALSDEPAGISSGCFGHPICSEPSDAMRDLISSPVAPSDMPE
jgi:hypothetical protein